MPDIITVLPDSVANKIAAGEVILRPASVIKELLENSVDAGATRIQVVVEEGGKSSIQVIDDGCGMSETDARLCIERHATSKIKTADDLFKINSLGFRGEALASVSAVAQVAIRTKRHDEETGTEVTAENSTAVRQEPYSGPEGTSVTVKNLFYNIPARKKFLKNNVVEFRHISEEFIRIALSHPLISFALYHNGKNIFQLEKSSLRQRIVAVFGKLMDDKLVPVEENTYLLKINGFSGKPEHAKKSRSEQYLFVNHRYVRSPYLHHALTRAYEGLVPAESHILYVLFIETDPAAIDVNIHPTKSEIKFDNEQAVYSILAASVKRALGKSNLVPSIDFDVEKIFDPDLSPPTLGNPVPGNSPILSVPGGGNQNFRPFPGSGTGAGNLRHWEKLYGSVPDIKNFRKQQEPETVKPEHEQLPMEIGFPERIKKEPGFQAAKFFTVHNKFIIAQVKSGLLIIDRQAAMERIMYEQFSGSLNKTGKACQQVMFPFAIDLAPEDFMILSEIEDDVAALGFDLRQAGKYSYLISGMPPGVPAENPKDLIEEFIQQYRMNLAKSHLEPHENMARSMAKNVASRMNKQLSDEEISELADRLFACRIPNYSPDGKPSVKILSLEELKTMFGH